MTLPPDLHRLGETHRRRQQELARKAVRVLTRLWGRIDKRDPLTSWRFAAAPAALRALSTAQLFAAGAADGYVAAALAQQHEAGAPAGLVSAQAFAGIASDGRPLDSLLEQPAFEVQAFLDQGMSPDVAAAIGARHLARIAATQVADAARVSTGVATVASRAYGYIRMLTPPSCSRCVVLAGVFYPANAGFERHPLCDCVHVPASESLRDETTSPTAYFDSLDRAEQDRVFTKAGAQAIRDGADIAQVVNARRGAAGLSTAGARVTAEEARMLRGGRERGRLETRNVFGQDLFVTTEGTTIRGFAGKRLGAKVDGVKRPGGRYRSARPPRLMPESIYQIAGDDRDEAIRLLRRNGYIIGRESPVRPAPKPVVKTFAERVGDAASEKSAVDAPAFGLDRSRPAAFTQEMYDALVGYQGSKFTQINGSLRGKTVSPKHVADRVRGEIAALDAAMAASSLDREILTYRGVIDSRSMFGDRLEGNLAGMQWREDAFVSTTADKQITTLFSIGARNGQKPMVMRILTPAGTPAVEISNMQIEAEVLLGRGLRLRVVEDRGVDPDGVRHIDAEVLRE